MIGILGRVESRLREVEEVKKDKGRHYLYLVVVRRFQLIIMLGHHQNLKSRSRPSSSSSGSDKILYPQKIEKLIKINSMKKDLFDRLLEENSIMETENQPYDQHVQKTIAGLNLSPRQHSQSNHPGCKCTKIDCLKLYCECFAKGRICNENCICTCCHNTIQNQEQIVRAKSIVNYRQPGYFSGVPSYVPTRKCTCKKSLCQKKYCECYNAGLKCTEDCQCYDCHNGKPELLMSLDSRMEIQVHA